MTWDDARLFLEVARTSSLAGAALTLQMDQTTVSRRLKRFEKSLGQPLFDVRDGRRVLTVLGDALWLKAQAMEQAAAQMQALAEGAQRAPFGNVRVGVTAIVAKYVLAPRLPQLHAAYPHVTLEFLVSDDLADLSRLEVDVAVRLMRPTQGDYAIQRVGHLRFRAYRASAAVGDLPFASFCGRLAQSTGVAELEQQWRGPPPLFRTDDADVFHAVVRSGAAIGYVPSVVGDADLQLRPTGHSPDLLREAWLLSRAETTQAAHIVAVKEWIAQSFAALNMK